MHPRYLDPQIAQIWGEQNQIDIWTLIEMAHLQVVCGYVSLNPKISVDAVRAREELTGHDVGAFLELLEAALPFANQRWLHFGLTSSDLVDTGNAIRFNQTNVGLQNKCNRLYDLTLNEKFEVPVLGRTHGQPASATRVKHRLQVALSPVADFSPRKMRAMFSGAVGRGTWLSQSKQYEIASLLGMNALEWSTQVMPRQLFHDQMWGWLRLVQACEQVALDVRLQSMLGEVSEPRKQVGSSTMPGKVNPIRAEKICGLARVARGLFHAEIEGSALWLDRDLTHSSVDRIAFGDLAELTGYILEQTTILLQTLEIDQYGIHRNLLQNQDRKNAEDNLARAVLDNDLPRSENYRRIARGDASTPGQGGNQGSSGAMHPSTLDHGKQGKHNA